MTSNAWRELILVNVEDCPRTQESSWSCRRPVNEARLLLLLLIQYHGKPEISSSKGRVVAPSRCPLQPRQRTECITSDTVSLVQSPRILQQPLLQEAFVSSPLRGGCLASSMARMTRCWMKDVASPSTPPTVNAPQQQSHLSDEMTP